MIMAPVTMVSQRLIPFCARRVEVEHSIKPAVPVIREGVLTSAVEGRSACGLRCQLRENPINQAGSVALSAEDVRGCRNAFIDKNGAFDPKKATNQMVRARLFERCGPQ